MGETNWTTYPLSSKQVQEKQAHPMHVLETLNSILASSTSLALRKEN